MLQGEDFEFSNSEYAQGKYDGITFSSKTIYSTTDFTNLGFVTGEIVADDKQNNALISDVIGANYQIDFSMVLQISKNQYASIEDISN